MKIASCKPERVNGQWAVTVTDSTGETHVIGCRSLLYCIELNTVIELGIMLAAASPETTAADLAARNLCDVAEKVLGTCPECESPSINNKCTAQCGKERT